MPALDIFKTQISPQKYGVCVGGHADGLITAWRGDFYNIPYICEPFEPIAVEPFDPQIIANRKWEQAYDVYTLRRYAERDSEDEMWFYAEQSLSDTAAIRQLTISYGHGHLQPVHKGNLSLLQSLTQAIQSLRKLEKIATQHSPEALTLSGNICETIRRCLDFATSRSMGDVTDLDRQEHEWRTIMDERSESKKGHKTNES